MDILIARLVIIGCFALAGVVIGAGFMTLFGILALIDRLQSRITKGAHAKS